MPVSLNLIYILGAVSGFSALLYQIVWMRQLGLMFGSSAVSVGICLSSFMAGLGVGSLCLGRIADRVRRPERLYFWLELGIGIYGFFSLDILSPDRSLFLPMPETAGPFLLLLVPTFLMGGTFPAAVRYLSECSGKTGRPIGLFYAVNTAGGAAAAFLFPLVLFESLGAEGAMRAAAALNFLAAAGTLWLRTPGAFSPGASIATDTGDRPALSANGRALVGMTLLLSGFSSLGLETLYNRVFSLTFGGTIFSFSFVLGVVLVGIAAGSRVFSVFEDKFGALKILFFSQFTTLIWLFASIPLLDRSVFLQMTLFSGIDAGFVSFQIANVAVAAVYAGIPALGFGASYPAAMKLLADDPSRTGSKIGFWSAINLAGSTFGPLAVTFILLPAIGSQKTFTVMAAGVAVSLWMTAMAAGPRAAGGRWMWSSAATGVVLTIGLWHTTWDIRYFHAQVGSVPEWAKRLWNENKFREHCEKVKILYFREGANGTVSVVHVLNQPDEYRNNASLMINGKVDASNNDADMVTQSLLAHLPMLFKPNARTALNVGLGSGVTAAALAMYPLGRITAVEISPDVAAAARIFFSKENRDVFNQEKVHLVIEDGRRFLAVRPDTYDLIVSEPSNAWLSGVSNLFTREYFSLVRRRLSPGGLFCQWFYTYSMSWENLMTLLSTLNAEFPHLRIFNFSQISSGGDLIVLGSASPIEIDPLLLKGLPLQFMESSELSKIQTLADVTRAYVGGSENFGDVWAGNSLHTDRRPVLELRGPRDQLGSSVTENLFRFAEIRPEVTIPWAGGEGGYTSGVRVVQRSDRARTQLRKQSYIYSFRETTDSASIEIYSPMTGMSDPRGHLAVLRVLGNGIAASQPEKEFNLNGHPVSSLITRDGQRDVAWLAWNCPAAQRTFYVKYSFPPSPEKSAFLPPLHSIPHCHSN